MAPRQPCGDHVPDNKKKQIDNAKDSNLVKSGEILIDIQKKKWKLGNNIGAGAFGDIYLASENLSKPVAPDSKFVVKMEPLSNGPLFVERNFYVRAGKEETINQWKTSKKLKHLGMPNIISFGTHMYKRSQMRFIIMPRYGDNVEKMLLQKSHKFHIKTALTIANYTIDVLEFIHSQGFIHSDIKALNIVLGVGSGQAPLYLVDYGLAQRFRNPNGSHKDDTPDSRLEDAGTMEFCSRDAHLGVITRRSDFESLGFNLITWLGGNLPWINLSNSDLVFKLKNEAMSDIKIFLLNAFPKSAPIALFDYFVYVSKLAYDSKPDYKLCKNLFSNAIKEAGFTYDGKITFDSHAKLNKKRPKSGGCENLIPFKKLKHIANTDSVKKNCSYITSINTRVTRNLYDNSLEKFDWALILASHPDKPVPKNSKPVPRTNKSNFDRNILSVENNNCLLSNPTPAMLKVIENRAKRGTETLIKKGRSDSLSKNVKKYNTPAMDEVIANRKKNHRILRPRIKCSD